MRNKCIIDGVALSLLVQTHYIRSTLFHILQYFKSSTRQKRNTAMYVIHNTARDTQSINVHRLGLAVVTREYNNGVHSRLVIS